MQATAAVCSYLDERNSWVASFAAGNLCCDEATHAVQGPGNNGKLLQQQFLVCGRLGGRERESKQHQQGQVGTRSCRLLLVCTPALYVPQLRFVINCFHAGFMGHADGSKQCTACVSACTALHMVCRPLFAVNSTFRDCPNSAPVPRVACISQPQHHLQHTA